MGVYLELEDLNRVFEHHSGLEPTILNDVEAFTEEKREELDRLIMTRYSGDMLSNIPVCGCGKTSGKYNLNVLCECGTRVSEVLDQDLIPMVWIRAPKNVVALMNPKVWTILKNHFSISGFNVIHWLCDTRYRPTVNIPRDLVNVENLIISGEKIQRGYNYFVTHFDEIIDKLMSIKPFSVKKDDNREIRLFLSMYRHCVFPRYLPIPHKSILVVETNNTGTYVDTITTQALDSVRMLVGIDTSYNVYSTRDRENRAIRAIDQLALFGCETEKNTFARKEGIFRKHVYATRSHWAFRAVVSSITDKHEHDEIYIPWGIAISVFKIHIEAIMLRMGYTPVEVVDMINEHARKYSPLLDSVLDQIIKGSPNGRGVSCTLGRNPSLHRSSIQHVKITKVKKNPNDPTVSMSILIVRGLNADFDGRQHCRR